MNKVIFTLKDGTKKEFPGEKFTDEHLAQFRRGDCYRFNCSEACPLTPGKDCHTRVVLSDVSKVERVVEPVPRLLSGFEVDGHLETFCGLDSRELMSAIEYARRHGWKPKPKKVKKMFWFTSHASVEPGKRRSSHLYESKIDCAANIENINKPDLQVHSIEVEVEE